MKTTNKALRSTFIFKKKAAIRLSNLPYYKAQGRNQKQYFFLESEKRRLATPKWDKVTMLLEKYRDKGFTQLSTTGKILQGIYNHNVQAAKGGSPPPKHSRLLQLIAKPETLLLAYRSIRGNKGALTKGGYKTQGDIQQMTPLQRAAYFRSNIFPDGFSLKSIFLISALLKQNKYPLLYYY